MLDTYRKLEANGVIGKMMKVGVDGREVVDLTGEQAGTLVVRPFQEFPKVVRRVGRDGKVKEILVQSKSEELRLLAQNPDDFDDVPLSPLERERNELAQQNAEQNKTIMSMQTQMAAMMEQLAKLSQAVEQRNAQDAALGSGAPPVKVEGKVEGDVSKVSEQVKSTSPGAKIEASATTVKKAN